jgi:hypothetical protein
MRSIIVWVAVVMMDHLCFDPRRRASPDQSPFDGRPPGVNFPGIWSVGGGTE